jgi:hypothetical protein
MKFLSPKTYSIMLRRVLALALVIAFAGVHIAHQHFQHSLGSGTAQIESAAGARQQAEAIGHSQAPNACPICSLLGHLSLAKHSTALYQEPLLTVNQRACGYEYQRPCQILANLPSPRAPPADLT